MIAVDTSVVVRFLVRDDEEQWARADQLFRQNDVAIVPTVLMEIEWVLRSSYGLKREQIARALRGLCGAERVVVSDAGSIEDALAGYERGFDFADALHAAEAGRRDMARFVTFDRRLAKHAGRHSLGIEIELL